MHPAFSVIFLTTLLGVGQGLFLALFSSQAYSVVDVLPAQSGDFYALGAFIALYERAVGFYGSLVNVNAYHQPGVEAGKKAAASVLKLLARTRGALSAQPQTAGQIASALGEDAEAVYHALTHLAANDARVRATAGATVAADAFALG